jgi:lycopene beta-cyclase
MLSNSSIDHRFDYIITGAGCAGLSLLMHMIRSGGFSDKRILLIDKDEKKANDRTWCFWEEEPGFFEEIVHRQWTNLTFASNHFSANLDIHPYVYKLIRGKDFYQFCFEEFRRQPNVTAVRLQVEKIFRDSRGCHVIAGGEKFTSSYVFNSIIFDKPRLKKNEYWLLQHFAGWLIETETPVFTPSSATLMDFKTDQLYGTTFFYVLPFSATTALVEYTIFSDQVLPPDVYNNALDSYIRAQLQHQHFHIVEKEFGVIPMTNFSFPVSDGNIINIGTAGGQTKGSSGYTFKFIQKSSQAVVRALTDNRHPADYISKAERFSFYDSVLLNILYNKQLGGDYIFSELFKKNKASNVLRFLDNETTLMQELRIIKSLPMRTFSRAAIDHVRLSI